MGEKQKTTPNANYNKKGSRKKGSQQVGNNVMKDAVKKALKGKKKQPKVITGVIKWFDPKHGFGFITTDDGQDVFIHKSAIKEGRTYLGFEDQDRVTFNVVSGEKGLLARNVHLVSNPEEDPEANDTESTDQIGNEVDVNTDSVSETASESVEEEADTKEVDGGSEEE